MERAQYEWFRSRLPAYAYGLLPTDESERLELLIAEHPFLREEVGHLMSQRVPPDAADGHIPNAVLARWRRARRLLTGLERDAVRKHLKVCSRCQNKLRFLGEEPDLTDSPRDDRSQLAEAAMDSRAWRRRKSAVHGKHGYGGLAGVVRAPLGRLALAGWAAAAVAAFLLIGPLLEERRGVEHYRLVPISVTSTRGGGPHGDPTYEIDASGAGLAIVLTLPEAPHGAEGEMWVTDPTETEVLRTNGVVSDFTYPRTVLLKGGAGGLTTGRYKVLARVEGVKYEHSFVLKRSQ